MAPRVSRHDGDPSTKERQKDVPTGRHMVIVFGRPGAGKTTVAEQAVQSIQTKGQTSSSSPYSCCAIDLDVCVPQWMRDNFAQGVYPALAERLEFAESACDHVLQQQYQQQHQSQSQLHQAKDGVTTSSMDEVTRTTVVPEATTITIVSFSFVNTDLRNVFRQRFPYATWVLIDTTEMEAQRRIEQRQGHFYKGQPSKSQLMMPPQEDPRSTTPLIRMMTPTTTTNDPVMVASSDNDHLQRHHKDEHNGEEDTSTDATTDNNSDWYFAPVTFDHVVLPGTDSVEANAQRVIHLIQSWIVPQKQV
jgi:gluconate kinase